MTLNYLKRDDKPSLAYVFTRGIDENLPVVMFCGGYRSDMNGSKAQFLEEQCRSRGQGYLRFDYSGHGVSEGVFEDLTITDWLEDALAMFEALVGGPVILVGSSMGGWIALLLALRLKDTGYLKGIVGLAAAPDFTEEMFYERLDKEQQSALMADGVVYVPNDYSDEPYAFTRAFYEDGQRNLVLGGTHDLGVPVRMIQGMADKDVAWGTALKIQKAFGLLDDDLVFIEGGDHRLSSPEQLNILWRTLNSF